MAAAIAALVAAAAPALASPARTAVKAAPPPVEELGPTAGATYFAWSQNSAAHPGHWNEYAQARGRPGFRVNAAATSAYAGGISGDVLAYDQVAHGQEDIRLYNLRTRVRSRPPAGVNTPHPEYQPSLSGHRLLFGRVTATTRFVVLYDLGTHTGTALSTIARGSGTVLEPGQVDGDFATFTRCPTPSTCAVWLYRISTATLVRIPNPAGREHTAPAVSPAGTLYYDESGAGCGAAVALERLPLGGTATTVMTFRRGIDSVHPQVFTGAAGHDNLYYERYACTTGSTDIYRVVAH